MSDKQRASENTKVETVAKPDKATYSAPQLRVYGSVSKLTLGAGGTKSGDAGLMMAL